MIPVRLNKFLVETGVCSRREADRLIQAGKITVNGASAVLGLKVTDADAIEVEGEPIKKSGEKRVYIAYHKPVGIICTSDPNAKDNIISAVGYPERIFHIGRLDVASSGLILLTNDGDVVNAILRSEGKHEKEYIVKVDRDLRGEDLDKMATGIDIGDNRDTLPAKIAKMGPRMLSMTLIEGRNRQVRRMCEALGYVVVALKRIRVMHIVLDDLPPGKWRYLTDDETRILLKTLAIK